MKAAVHSAVSTVRTKKHKLTRQQLMILQFIHRFSLVTTRHIQVFLNHASNSPTYRQLQYLRKLGYIDRHDSRSPNNTTIDTSYYLTPAGLSQLKEQKSLTHYRHIKSITANASATIQRRLHYHTLADAYVHFKLHYDGCFTMHTDFDLTRLEDIPDETPDGFVRISLPDHPVQYYFIEIYGWNRSTQSQKRRIDSYFHYAESQDWDSSSMKLPSVFVIAGSTNAQDRIEKQLRNGLYETLATDLHFYTTVATKLDGDQSSIWRKV